MDWELLGLFGGIAVLAALIIAIDRKRITCARRNAELAARMLTGAVVTRPWWTMGLGYRVEGEFSGRRAEITLMPVKSPWQSTYENSLALRPNRRVTVTRRPGDITAPRPTNNTMWYSNRVWYSQNSSTKPNAGHLIFRDMTEEEIRGILEELRQAVDKVEQGA